MKEAKVSIRRRLRRQKTFATCPVCRYRQYLRRSDGMIGRHAYTYRYGQYVECPGTGQRPDLAPAEAALLLLAMPPIGDEEWRVATVEEAETRICRWSSQYPCPGRVVAAMIRVSYSDGLPYERLWYYCANHLYGRRIEDGEIIEQEEAAA